MRSENLQIILDSITPEEEEKWKQNRIERQKKLTTEYQLGYYVGLYIVRDLPTLSTDSLQTRRVVQVSEEDVFDNERLNKEWFETTSYGSKWDGVNENGNKEKWELYLQHNQMLKKKYLPNPSKHYINILNVQNMNEFKEGLRVALWDCDLCNYDIEPENIKIYDEEDGFATIIELKLG
jgi:hypothetical protein